MDGIFIVDKPVGVTSGAAAGMVRRCLKAEKSGHAGSLDKNASGMLIVAVDKGVKLLQPLSSLDKVYHAAVSIHDDRDEGSIRKVLVSFIGENIQIPPKRSAVSRKKRARNVYSLALIGVKGRKVHVEIHCQSGFYVRRFAAQLGEKLGCNSHLSSLRRISIGPFGEAEMREINLISSQGACLIIHPPAIPSQPDSQIYLNLISDDPQYAPHISCSPQPRVQSVPK
ncbi:MAG: hypothetical protein HYX24_02950, partial [Candidatus Aenigmarchaeota archaeon]|nr:hypothetical protein [Candidatus Aenigmarchaeota archaeon]